MNSNCVGYVIKGDLEGDFVIDDTIPVAAEQVPPIRTVGVVGGISPPTGEAMIA